MKTIKMYGAFFLVTFFATNLFAAEIVVKTTPTLTVQEPVIAPIVVAPTVTAPVVVAPEPVAPAPVIAVPTPVVTPTLIAPEPVVVPAPTLVVPAPTVVAPIVKVPVVTPTVAVPIAPPTIKTPVLTPDIKTPIALPAVQLKEPAITSPEGIVPGHHYTVTETTDDGMVVLRNPWGSNEPDAQEPTDINSVVQGVLRESYLETNEDLQSHADKVRSFNESKKAVRERLDDIRSMKSEFEGGQNAERQRFGEKATPTFSSPPIGKNVSRLMKTGKTDTLARELQVFKMSIEQSGSDRNFFVGKLKEANDISDAMANHVRESNDANFAVPENIKIRKGMGPREMSQQLLMQSEYFSSYAEKMKARLTSAGDDGQLANIDLQNMLQKQQQTIQMLSNVSKVLHDTAMAVKRKIG